MSTLSIQFTLEGLCCEKCAAKIEKDINRLQGIDTASVNPETTILSIVLLPGASIEDLYGDISKIVATHDSDVVIKQSAT